MFKSLELSQAQLTAIDLCAINVISITTGLLYAVDLSIKSSITKIVYSS